MLELKDSLNTFKTHTLDGMSFFLISNKKQNYLFFERYETFFRLHYCRSLRARRFHGLCTVNGDVLHCLTHGTLRMKVICEPANFEAWILDDPGFLSYTI